MGIIRTRSLQQTSVVVLGILFSSTAYAQSHAASDDAGTASAALTAGSDQVGEIVVTAQRRSERLQDIPLAVTAVTAATVEKLGLTNVVDIGAVTPGAFFNTNNGFFSPHIRGIGVDAASVGLEAPVAIYEDGAYLTRTLTVNEILENFDIANIQVLRGPQGTLYGRNATGGVILINSADPTSKFEGRVRGEFGNLERRALNAMINVPLGEDLALRATGSYKHEGGFVHNVTTGKDVGGGRSYSVRAKLRWQPENADIVLGGQYYNTQYSLGPLGTLLRNDSTCLGCAVTPVRPGLGFYEQENETLVQPVKTEYYGANLKMTFNVGDFELSSTTTYRKQKTIDSGSDQDYTPAFLFEFSVPKSGGRSFTQDFQVSSKMDGPLNYLFGLSYLYDKGYFNPRFLGAFFGGSLDPDTAPGFDDTATTRSYAAFLEGYYQIAPQLKATVGGRYTYEQRAAHGVNRFGATPFSFDLSTAQRAFTPRFVLAWDNGPTNVYYSFTRGFKAGGFPGPFANPVAPVKAEKIFSHEVGVKQSMLGNRLRLNAAAFYFKNKDQQVQTLDNLSGGLITANAGALENYGIEVEAQITPVDGVTLGASGAWQHARYKPFRAASLTCFNPNASPTLSACFKDVTGTPPPGAPDWSGSFNANYEFAIGSWTGSLSGIAQYRSSINFQPGAGGDLRADRDGSRFLVNASGYISPPGENLRVGFYANNVFNKTYPAFIQTAQPFGVYYNAPRPRTYGLRMEYAF